jgi:hypothetical protein
MYSKGNLVVVVCEQVCSVVGGQAGEQGKLAWLVSQRVVAGCVSREASDSFPVGKECLSLCVVCEGRQGPQEGVPLAVVVGGGCCSNDPLHHLIWYFFNYTIPYIIYYTI